VKLLIAGGGTGGHVFPALAIAQEWLSRGNEREVVLVGTKRGIEMRLGAAGRAAAGDLARGRLKGKGGATLLKNLAMLVPAMLDARRILRKHKPIAAFGVGGYAAGPMLLTTGLGECRASFSSPTPSRASRTKCWLEFLNELQPAMKFLHKSGVTKQLLPGVRAAGVFFQLASRRPEKPFRLLITGGTRGAADQPGICGCIGSTGGAQERVGHRASDRRARL